MKKFAVYHTAMMRFFLILIKSEYFIQSSYKVNMFMFQVNK